MRPRSIAITLVVAGSIVLGGCGLGRGIGTSLYCLGGGWGCGGKPEGTELGTLRLENGTDAVYIALSGIAEPGSEPERISGEEEPLIPGGSVEVSFPAGAWSEIQVHAADGTVYRFFNVLLAAGDLVVLRLA